ncbi:MAG TPA: helix-turn-helix domain-containing protein [Terriglobia bacterium]|jgi:excisionase family DNA binding protein|nr:helix-turn-helix domain-containing protein [Terriglobia bacterium]
MTEVMTEIKESETELMTVRETANFLRLKESTIRDWVLRRKITFVKLGGRVFIRKVDAEALIERCLVEAIQ